MENVRSFLRQEEYAERFLFGEVIDDQTVDFDGDFGEVGRGEFSFAGGIFGGLAEKRMTGNGFCRDDVALFVNRDLNIDRAVCADGSGGRGIRRFRQTGRFAVDYAERNVSSELSVFLQFSLRPAVSQYPAFCFRRRLIDCRDF